MTEALQAVVAYGFEGMGLNRIEALVYPRNVACWRLLEKCRFIKEGVLRDYEYERGRFNDLVVYAMLQRDWKTLMKTSSKFDANSHAKRIT